MSKIDLNEIEKELEEIKNTYINSLYKLTCKVIPDAPKDEKKMYSPDGLLYMDVMEFAQEIVGRFPLAYKRPYLKDLIVAMKKYHKEYLERNPPSEINREPKLFCCICGSHSHLGYWDHGNFLCLECGSRDLVYEDEEY